MATSVITNKKFSLTLNDFWKGLIVATLTAPLTTIYTTIDAGSFNINWKAIGLVALSGFLSYIIKNFFTPTQTVVTNPTPAETSQITPMAPPTK